jgi:hypothetical protein
MLQRFSFTVRKWLALRSFPHGKPTSSYVFVDFFTPYGGLHDRVMAYKHNGNAFLHFSSTSPLSAKDDISFKTTVRPEALNKLIAWIGERLPDAENVFLTKIRRDPAKLTLFAFDPERNRKYSVCVYDTHLYEEYKNIRAEIIERVKRMAPGAGICEEKRTQLQ